MLCVSFMEALCALKRLPAEKRKLALAIHRLQVEVAGLSELAACTKKMEGNLSMKAVPES